jgi:hypothetical protein
LLTKLRLQVKNKNSYDWTINIGETLTSLLPREGHRARARGGKSLQPNKILEISTKTAKSCKNIPLKNRRKNK